MGETKLEIVQHHVPERLERLEQNRTLISNPPGHGNYYNFVPAARRFLTEMEQYQAELEDEFETVLRDEQ